MPACCAFGCSTQSGKGLALFSVPLGKHDKTRRKAWLHRIGRKNFKPTKSSKLCERHFTDDQFEQTILRSFGTKKLKCSAVPSIFSHRPEKRPRKAPHPRGAGKQTVMYPAIVPLPGSDMLQPAAGVVPTPGKLIRSDEIRSAVYSTKFMETVAIVAFLAGNTLQPSVETAPHSAIELGV
ncbi:THAP domain-containing protein 1-like [Rhipicephalus sanguineus]|uniref:THAP domain-containing protein 1-like n=1 Tax=Rhipicephalus sanguineus TaxID=34632 RepID=UPI0020C2C985|nr:THAP domain-containing protein 1-like [Rhipicephalus sanguineus]